MVLLIEQHRTEIDILCHQFGVRRLEVFGSAATGAFRDDSSDLDFLVEFEPAISGGPANQYFGFKEALEALFGRPVDLIIPSAIENPYLRQSVDESRALLYAV